MTPRSVPSKMSMKRVWRKVAEERGEVGGKLLLLLVRFMSLRSSIVTVEP